MCHPQYCVQKPDDAVTSLDVKTKYTPLVSFGSAPLEIAVESLADPIRYLPLRQTAQAAHQGQGVGAVLGRRKFLEHVQAQANYRQLGRAEAAEKLVPVGWIGSLCGRDELP